MSTLLPGAAARTWAVAIAIIRQLTTHDAHAKNCSTAYHALPAPRPRHGSETGRRQPTARRSAAARCSSAEMPRQASGASGQTTVNISTYPNSSAILAWSSSGSYTGRRDSSRRESASIILRSAPRSRPYHSERRRAHGRVHSLICRRRRLSRSGEPGSRATMLETSERANIVV